MAEMRYSNAKSEVIDLRAPLLKTAAAEICSIIRRHRLNYDQLSYCVREARKSMGQGSPRRPIRLPKNLTSVQLEDFFSQVKKSGNSTHEVLFQILYATGCRVSEICNAMRDDVDIEGGKIFVRQGKGAKDRIVLFPTAMRLPMRLYMDATRENLYLFESRRRQRLSTRWVQTLAKTYGEKAGIPDMHPHRLRHTLLTQLASDLTDAQLQAVSGHASRSSLNIYTQLSQRDVADKYEQLMR